jgi:hypothetical protein
MGSVVIRHLVNSSPPSPVPISSEAQRLAQRRDLHHSQRSKKGGPKKCPTSLIASYEASRRGTVAAMFRRQAASA